MTAASLTVGEAGRKGGRQWISGSRHRVRQDTARRVGVWLMSPIIAGLGVLSLVNLLI
jgi:hypothetical protein